MNSGRPEAICVAVVDSDPEWTGRLSVDLTEQLGAKVVVAQKPGELVFNGHVPCHVLVISRDADPDLAWLHELRGRYSERELPIIVTDSDDEDDHQIEATRAGANAFLDRSIHEDFALLGKLVSALAHE